jgi:polyisoprenoid-binding protein YceI
MHFDTLTTTGLAGSLASGTWILDPERSSLEFRAPLLYGKVGTVKGSFDRFRGTLDLAARPAIELAIAADSIDTGNRKRDEHLRSADFFDAAAHPEVRFESDSAALAGEAPI